METKFEKLDLVRDAKGELYVVDREKDYCPGSYSAISLKDSTFSDVSPQTEQRICSLPELPTAVRALLKWRELLDTGSGKPGTFGTHLTTAISIQDELEALLAPEEKEED